MTDSTTSTNHMDDLASSLSTTPMTGSAIQRSKRVRSPTSPNLATLRLQGSGDTRRSRARPRYNSPSPFAESLSYNVTDLTGDSEDDYDDFVHVKPVGRGKVTDTQPLVVPGPSDRKRHVERFFSDGALNDDYSSGDDSVEELTLVALPDPHAARRLDNERPPVAPPLPIVPVRRASSGTKKKKGLASCYGLVTCNSTPDGVFKDLWTPDMYDESNKVHGMSALWLSIYGSKLHPCFQKLRDSGCLEEVCYHFNGSWEVGKPGLNGERGNLHYHFSYSLAPEEGKVTPHRMEANKHFKFWQDLYTPQIDEPVNNVLMKFPAKFYGHMSVNGQTEEEKLTSSSYTNCYNYAIKRPLDGTTAVVWHDPSKRAMVSSASVSTNNAIISKYKSGHTHADILVTSQIGLINCVDKLLKACDTQSLQSLPKRSCGRPHCSRWYQIAADVPFACRMYHQTLTTEETSKFSGPFRWPTLSAKYKAWFAINSKECSPHVVAMHGMGGAGKTDIVQKLAEGHGIVADLANPPLRPRVGDIPTLSSSQGDKNWASSQPPYDTSVAPCLILDEMEASTFMMNGTSAPLMSEFKNMVGQCTTFKVRALYGNIELHNSSMITSSNTDPLTFITQFMPRDKVIAPGDYLAMTRRFSHVYLVRVPTAAETVKLTNSVNNLLESDLAAGVFSDHQIIVHQKFPTYENYLEQLVRYRGHTDPLTKFAFEYVGSCPPEEEYFQFAWKKYYKQYYDATLAKEFPIPAPFLPEAGDMDLLPPGL